MHWLQKVLLMGLLGGIPVAAAQSTGLPEVKRTGIEYKSPQAALEALRAKPGVTEREENDWVVLEDENTLWSIATVAHPAYPTAVKRAVVEKGGHVFVEMSVVCGASKEICDQVVLQFRELNENLRRSFER